jgi:hypothetical protein
VDRVRKERVTASHKPPPLCRPSQSVPVGNFSTGTLPGAGLQTFCKRTPPDGTTNNTGRTAQLSLWLSNRTEQHEAARIDTGWTPIMRLLIRGSGVRVPPGALFPQVRGTFPPEPRDPPWTRLPNGPEHSCAIVVEGTLPRCWGLATGRRAASVESTDGKRNTQRRIETTIKASKAR